MSHRATVRARMFSPRAHPETSSQRRSEIIRDHRGRVRRPGFPRHPSALSQRGTHCGSVPLEVRLTGEAADNLWHEKTATHQQKPHAQCRTAVAAAADPTYCAPSCGQPNNCLASTGHRRHSAAWSLSGPFPVTLWSVLKTVAFSWQQDVLTVAPS